MGNRVLDVVAGLVKRRSYQISGFQQGGSRSFCVGEELVTGKGGRRKGGRRTSDRRKGLLIRLVGAWILVLQLTHSNFPVMSEHTMLSGIEKLKEQSQKTLQVKSEDITSNGISKVNKQQNIVLNKQGQQEQQTLPVPAGKTIVLLDTLVGASLPGTGKTSKGMAYTFIPYDWKHLDRDDSLGKLLRKMQFFQTIIHAILDEALKSSKQQTVLALYVGNDYLILFAKRRMVTKKRLVRRVLRTAADFLSDKADTEADPLSQALLEQMDMRQQMIQATTLKCTLVYVVVMKDRELNQDFVKKRIYGNIPEMLLRADVQHGTCALPVSQELISQLLPGAISLHDLPV